ncbi:hypothetical protein [Amycolatopsis sp. H20-H5]|uniref:hypothetical protein n=1 Tax=Amycolatopsis sp. H20-H5 TaxID=3046309 RepID=UPI002DB9DC96|nr:hypothetical protein [Amycolatopsis sp. H20-H5]MEC3981163.1 hypothetical protein [Amycolatopsis sp. H20-H5]
MRKLQGFALVTGVALALLSGCAGGGGDGNKIASISSPPKTSEGNAGGNGSDATDASRADQARVFAKCMREHGVDMPDPKVSPDGKGIAVQAMPADGMDENKMKAADEACKKFLPNGGEMKPPSPEELDKLRKEAKCMREHGIDMPDPDQANPGRTTIGGGKDEQGKLEGAMKACGMGNGMAMPAVPAK